MTASPGSNEVEFRRALGLVEKAAQLCLPLPEHQRQILVNLFLHTLQLGESKEPKNRPRKELVPCAVCNQPVRVDRLERHTRKAHSAKGPARQKLPKAGRKKRKAKKKWPGPLARFVQGGAPGLGKRR